MNQQCNSEESSSTLSAKSSSMAEIIGTNEYGRGAKSDGQDTNSNEIPMRILTEDGDSLIIYFSRSGNTENLAKMIQKQLNVDVLELTITNPYPGKYEKTVNRANQERESKYFPKINTKMPDFSQYRRIYLGYQTWAMTLSNPIVSFLETYGEMIDGKVIYPFSSNAGYGEGNTIERIQALLPNSRIEKSFSVEDRDVIFSQAKVVNWLAN